MAKAGWFGLGCALALIGCGSEQAPGSGITMDKGGTGGAAGAAGSFSLGVPMGGGGGGGAGGGGAGGSGMGTVGGGGGNPGVALHTCPATPDPPCPAKMLSGTVIADNAMEWAALEGVTHVEGDLRLMSPLGLDSLACLETVTGYIELDFFAENGSATLWGLRNLTTVGETIDIRPDGDVYVDCGFSRLNSLGADYFTGGAVDVQGPLVGHLDLSSVKVNKHIRIKSSQLSKVTLPSDTTLIQGQLAFESNSKLSEVLGFTGITFTPDNITVGGAYSVMITNNPLLSECRARELAQFYLDAGDPPETVTVMDNLPCAM